jgi:hypothetical protein
VEQLNPKRTGEKKDSMVFDGKKFGPYTYEHRLLKGHNTNVVGKQRIWLKYLCQAASKDRKIPALRNAYGDSRLCTYIKGCKLWFDHHSSEQERLGLNLQAIQGVSRIAPSCAGRQFLGCGEFYEHSFRVCVCFGGYLKNHPKF